MTFSNIEKKSNRNLHKADDKDYFLALKQLLL